MLFDRLQVSVDTRLGVNIKSGSLFLRELVVKIKVQDVLVRDLCKLLYYKLKWIQAQCEALVFGFIKNNIRNGKVKLLTP